MWLIVQRVLKPLFKAIIVFRIADIPLTKDATAVHVARGIIFPHNLIHTTILKCFSD
jgi:hypothetical protein